MIKVALASDNVVALNSVKKILVNSCSIRNLQESKSGSLFTTTFTIDSNQELEIAEMFQLLENITGINTRKGGSKRRCSVRVRKAAGYLLHYRFGISTPKIAELLNYVSHASPLVHCQQFPVLKVSNRFVPIELAIRRVLNVVTSDKRGNRKRKRHEKEKTDV